MKPLKIMADSFVVRKQNLRIYRIREPYTATTLWLSRDEAITYLKEIQAKKLQADQSR